jgi:hypothetical protein
MPIQRDRVLFHQLDDVEAYPIFIMGLPRSGTTWLYATLSSLLPVASLSVYDLVHYGELLTAHRDGTAPALRKAIDARFNGMRTRGFDEIPLSHATVDEYGFVLRRYAGLGFVNSLTLATLKQLVRKLSFVQHRRHVLLKNPWDMVRGAFMAARLLGARFIFLRRDPARIFDSQLRMIEELAVADNPLLDLTTQGLLLETMILSGARRLRRLVGAAAFRRLFLGFVENGVYRESYCLRRSLAAVPRERRVEVSYEDLIADPAATLEPVTAFLGLPLERPLSTVMAKPRPRDLLPEVAARADRLRASIAALRVTAAPQAA